MFTHLHVHSEYSLLDSMCRINKLVARAKELGMHSLAITDHGNMYGVVDFYLACKEQGIKPIIGSEVYIAPSGSLARNSEKSQSHLVLLARNEQGYRNLVHLVTKAHLEGFYYKPRIDKKLLKEHGKGLIALTACIQGEIPRLLLEGRMDEAQKIALEYREVFDGFYLEIQRHPIPELDTINQGLLTLSKDTGIPLVATNDVHYIHKEDAPTHDLLLCIQTNTSVHDEKRHRMSSDDFYLKTEQEMKELFSDIPEALVNTSRIAEGCSLELDFGRLHLPEVGIPEGETADAYISRLCRDGLKKRYEVVTPEIEQRLIYELDVIQKTEFANYFLVVWDIISFARGQGIMCAVRGSAAASIVLYCLGITEIDPLKYGLVFERFLNVERKEMPDIDLDFEDKRRDEVLNYVVRKFGQDHVAHIITFGTLGARAALRDVGRALGMPYGDVDRIARLVPPAVNITLEQAVAQNGELASIYQDDEVVHQLVDSARRLEGIARHASTHAAGVVISRAPLIEHVPLQRVSKAEAQAMAMTQFTMENIARIGLLKMDFLGLANLTTLAKARETIRQSRGKLLDLSHLPLDDAKTYELLAQGETSGVFQLESGGMRKYIKELKPSVFNDVAAMIALYRPGPMEHIPTFIKSKHGLEPIRYLHPALEEILKETYGVIVYQEQVLHIVRALAGYSLGQADIFRKAMGKKIADVMRKQRQSFIEGAVKKNFSQGVAEEIFRLIEPFAGYAFNKAHSVSYAMIAYQTAYLKANYPVEYMTAFLNVHLDVMEKITAAVSECSRLGIRVLPPDINHSLVDFAIEKTQGGDAIRFGLGAIKNVGEAALKPMVEARLKGGEFKSMEDFCRRGDLSSTNRKVLESLIKVGVFDSLTKNRGGLLEGVEKIISLGQREQRLRQTGQATMFDLFGNASAVPMPAIEFPLVEVNIREKLQWEKELTGSYMSEHPMKSIAGNLPRNAVGCGQVTAEMDKQSVVLVGMVLNPQLRSTREGKTFVSATLEDLEGNVEVTAWPEAYRKSRTWWEEGNVLMVSGAVKVRDDRVSIICREVSPYQPSPSSEEPKTEAPLPAPMSAIPAPVEPEQTGNGANNAKKATTSRKLVIRITQGVDQDEDVKLLNKVIALLKEHPGQDVALLSIVCEEDVVNLELPGFLVSCDDALARSLAQISDRVAVEASEQAVP